VNGHDVPESVEALARRIMSGENPRIQSYDTVLYLKQPNMLAIQKGEEQDVWLVTLFYDTYIIDLYMDAKGNIVTNTIIRFNFDIRLDGKIR